MDNTEIIYPDCVNPAIILAKPVLVEPTKNANLAELADSSTINNVPPLAQMELMLILKPEPVSNVTKLVLLVLPLATTNVPHVPEIFS